MTANTATGSSQPLSSTIPVLRPDIVTRPRVRIRPAVPQELGKVTAAAATAPIVAVAVPEPMPSGSASETPTAEDGKASYAIGYGRPPRHSQFKKGQSGNPKGRPKGAKSFNTIVLEALTTKLAVRTAKGRKKVTQAQALLMQMVESALKGSQRDRHELLRYYRDAIPEDVKAGGHSSPANTAEPLTTPEDMDAHDRAILERLRANVLADLEDER